MRSKKLAGIFSVIFILSLFLASTAWAENFSGDQYIISGRGGENPGKVGWGAYFGTDANAPGTQNGQTVPASAPSYLPVLTGGAAGSAYAGGSGGNITFGKPTDSHTFSGNLYLFGGQGGYSEYTGMGANAGNARFYAERIDVAKDFSIRSGNAGSGGKGGNIIAEVNLASINGRLSIFGGAPAGESDTGNTTFKAKMIATDQGAYFEHTKNNVSVTIEQIFLRKDNAVAFFKSSGNYGRLNAKVNIITMAGKARLLVNGTKAIDVNIDRLSLYSGAQLTIDKQNNGNFTFAGLRAEVGTTLASTLPLQGIHTELVLGENMKNGDILLTSIPQLDITGLDLHLTVNDRPLKNLQKGQSIILIKNASGTYPARTINADCYNFAGSYVFEVGLQNNNLVATMK